MKRSETTNTFLEGLISDLNPLVTPNNVLTNCLNGTLITYNGNENVLLNDMGNGRVETAFLPEGYIPLGTAELGGIIYIVSYNPLRKKCLIGCFPSPERNITSREIPNSATEFKVSDLINDKMIKSPFKKIMLLEEYLHPGDKYQIYSTDMEYPTDTEKYISALELGNTNPDLYPKYLKFNVVAIQDNGHIINLNDSVVWNTSGNNYYISKADISDTEGNIDLDEYRELVKANYNVFNSKVDGQLALLAELECIDSFDVSWDAIKKGDNWYIYFFLNWTNKNLTDKINLYDIKINTNGNYLLKDGEYTNETDIQLTNFPSDITNNYTTDILEHPTATFYTPKYVDTIDEDINYRANNDGITTPRRNDGTDNLILLKTPLILNSNLPDILNLTIYPGMPFGYLEYLKLNISIDINKLGTGEIDLKEFRYYYEPNHITLNWGLDAYVEHNKNIKSVTFNFYKFDDTVYSGINLDLSLISQDNYVSFDDDRVIDETWDKTGLQGPSTGFGEPVKTMSIKKSSYSGNFTESITDLENNGLYLVEINIDYNGEKTITYYRFMYTSPIFNKYYFTKDDFSVISLNDAIDEIYTEDIDSPVLLNKSTIISDCNETPCSTISEIPSGWESSEKRQYSIESTYKYKIDFGINFNVKNNPIFDFKIGEIISNGIDKNINNFSSSAKQITISSNSSNNIEFEEDIETSFEVIEGSFNSSRYKATINYLITTPFISYYNNDSSILVNYELTPLKVDAGKYLQVGGRHKAVHLGIYNTSLGDPIVEDEYRDDYLGTNYLKRYPDVYEEILNLLTYNDIVSFKYSVYERSVEAKGFRWYHLSGVNMWYGYTTVGIIYAIKSSDNDIQLFTFKALDDNKWYNLSKATTANRWPSTIKPFALTPDFSSTTPLIASLNQYCKLVAITDQQIYKPYYTCSKIESYNNFNWNTTLLIPITSSVNLKINSVEISNYVTIENKSVKVNVPKNLKYDKSISTTISLNLKDKETFDLYITQAFTIQQTPKYVKKDDLLLQINTIDTRYVYDSNGNKVIYLKMDRGGGNNISDLSNSKHYLRIDDSGKLYIDPIAADIEYVTIIGYLEELALGINNILMV